MCKIGTHKSRNKENANLYRYGWGEWWTLEWTGQKDAPVKRVPKTYVGSMKMFITAKYFSWKLLEDLLSSEQETILCYIITETFCNTILSRLYLMCRANSDFFCNMFKIYKAHTHKVGGKLELFSFIVGLRFHAGIITYVFMKCSACFTASTWPLLLFLWHWNL